MPSYRLSAGMNSIYIYLRPTGESRLPDYSRLEKRGFRIFTERALRLEAEAKKNAGKWESRFPKKSAQPLAEGINGKESLYDEPQDQRFAEMQEDLLIDLAFEEVLRRGISRFPFPRR